MNQLEIGVTLKDGKRQVFVRKTLDGKVSEPVHFEPAGDGDVVLSVKAAPLTYEFFCQPKNGSVKNSARR